GLNMAKLKYLRGAIFMLKWSVLYPIDPKNSLLKKCLHGIWGFFYILSLLSIVIQCIGYLLITPFDLVEEAVTVMNTVIYTSLFTNFILFYYKSDDLVNFVQNINNNFADGTDNGIEQISMKQSANVSDKLAYYWTTSTILGSLAPTIFYLTWGNKNLPIPAWFPYDYQKSPQYEFTYMWQVFALINLGTIYGTTDMIYLCITILMAQQFKILSSNVKNYFYKALIRAGVSRSTAIKLSKNLNDEDNSPKHHQMLLHYCDDINNLMSTFLLMKLAGTTFNLIFIAFSLVTHLNFLVFQTGNRAAILSSLTYGFFVTSELFIYTYSGQILTQ
ncbi:7tm 6 domain containing protein, partial [Asbolus verrucosus]